MTTKRKLKQELFEKTEECKTFMDGYLEEFHRAEELSAELAEIQLKAKVQSDAIAALIEENKKIKAQLSKERHLKEALEARFSQIFGIEENI